MNSGEEKLVECLKDYPEMQKNYLAAFRSLARIHSLMFTEHPSEEQTELLAKECEDYIDNLPGWFPSQDIQRKAYVLGMILPIFIRREKAMIFNFLSAEERGESLHKLFNEFERQYCSISYRPLRYLSMKKAYFNRINL